MMLVRSIWRTARPWKRAVSFTGLAAAVVLLGVPVLHPDRTNLAQVLFSGSALTILSVALLLEGYRFRRRRSFPPPTPPPGSEANAAVMPLPAAPPPDAVARTSS